MSEFSNDKELLLKKVIKLKFWEWIPVLGGYLFFARINFTKNNFVKPIRKAVGAYAKYWQIACSIVGLPFAIWTIVLIAQHGWSFKMPMIGLISVFGLQFLTAYQWQQLYLRGLLSVK